MKRNREAGLLDAIASLRREHGDAIADAAIAAVTRSVEFIRCDGHGNIQISVKDHRVASKLRFELYKDLEQES